MDGAHSRRSLPGAREGKKERTVERSCDLNQDEEDLVIRMHRLLGDRWALIAGRIPGRTPEEIERYWKLRERSMRNDKKTDQI